MLLSGEQKTYFARSDQPSPTLYVSFLPEFAEQFAAQKKGIIFVGSSFIVGLLGDPTVLDFKLIEDKATELSSKQIKVVKKDNVTFKFKDKKKKPVKVTNILQFMITGADFNLDKLGEDLEHLSFKEME